MLLSTSVEALSLSERARNCLKTARIATLGDLVEWSPSELLLVKNLGKKTVTVIRHALAARGLELRSNTSGMRFVHAVNLSNPPTPWILTQLRSPAANDALTHT